MITGIHPKQVRGTYGSTLYDQLRSLDLDMSDLNIDYEYDPDTGAVLRETVTDPLTAEVVKTAAYAYHPDGSVRTETVTRGTAAYVKTFLYDPDTGNIRKVEIRSAT